MVNAMGKVLSNKGGGLYSVEIYYDGIDTVQDRIAELTELIVPIEAEITAQYFVVQEEKDTLITILDRQDYLISQLSGFVPASDEYAFIVKSIQIVTADGLIQRQALYQEAYTLAQLEAQKTAWAVEKTTLQNKVNTLVNPFMDVWCTNMSDGANGRPSYAVNEEVMLICLAYDAGNDQEAKYLLPPLNLYGGAPYYTLLEFLEDTHLNIADSYKPLTAACMTFYNVAMECGFAKWEPRFVCGTVIKKESDGGRDCSFYGTGGASDQYYIGLQVKGSVRIDRPDNDFLSPNEHFTFDQQFPLLAAAGLLPDYFEAGDPVVIWIPKGRSEDATFTGIILGWCDGPKIDTTGYTSGGSCDIDTFGLNTAGFVSGYLVLEEPYVSESFGTASYGYTGGQDQGDDDNYDTLEGSYTPKRKYLVTDEFGVTLTSFGDCEVIQRLHVAEGGHTVHQVWPPDSAGTIGATYIEYHVFGAEQYIEIGNILIPYYTRTIDEYGTDLYTNAGDDYTFEEVVTQVGVITDLCFGTGGFNYQINTTTKSIAHGIQRDMLVRTDVVLDCNGLSEETETVVFDTSTPLVFGDRYYQVNVFAGVDAGYKYYDGTYVGIGEGPGIASGTIKTTVTVANASFNPVPVPWGGTSLAPAGVLATNDTKLCT